MYVNIIYMFWLYTATAFNTVIWLKTILSEKYIIDYMIRKKERKKEEREREREREREERERYSIITYMSHIQPKRLNFILKTFN